MAEREREGIGAGAVLILGAGIVGLGVLGAVALAAPKVPSPPPSGKANVYGRVTDSSTGNPVPDALLTLDSMQASSDSTGSYSFLDIDPKTYALTCQKEGYQTISESIDVAEGNNEVNIAMTPTAVTPPVYAVAVSFERERVCLVSKGDQCLEWSTDEREAVITIANLGAAGQFTITFEAWLYRNDGLQLQRLAYKEWPSEGPWPGPSTYFEVGQTRTYSKTYGIPETGEPVHVRYFLKVFDPDGNLISDEVFITSL
jgi:hypothetical protein